MGQSYDIYLRDKTGEQRKPTQPRISGGSNTFPAQNESTSTDQKAASAALKAGKAAIIAYATYKVVEKVHDTILPFVTRETGDYRYAVAYNNVRQTISNIINPAGYLLRRETYFQETRILNYQHEQQRLLIGDAYVNSISRKV